MAKKSEAAIQFAKAQKVQEELLSRLSQAKARIATGDLSQLTKDKEVISDYNETAGLVETFEASLREETASSYPELALKAAVSNLEENIKKNLDTDKKQFKKIREALDERLIFLIEEFEDELKNLQKLKKEHAKNPHFVSIESAATALKDYYEARIRYWRAERGALPDIQSQANIQNVLHNINLVTAQQRRIEDDHQAEQVRQEQLEELLSLALKELPRLTEPSDLEMEAREKNSRLMERLAKVRQIITSENIASFAVKQADKVKRVLSSEQMLTDGYNTSPAGKSVVQKAIEAGKEHKALNQELADWGQNLRRENAGDYPFENLQKRVAALEAEVALDLRASEVLYKQVTKSSIMPTLKSESAQFSAKINNLEAQKAAHKENPFFPIEEYHQLLAHLNKTDTYLANAAILFNTIFAENEIKSNEAKPETLEHYFALIDAATSQKEQLEARLAQNLPRLEELQTVFNTKLQTAVQLAELDRQFQKEWNTFYLHLEAQTIRNDNFLKELKDEDTRNELERSWETLMKKTGSTLTRIKACKTNDLYLLALSPNEQPSQAALQTAARENKPILIQQTTADGTQEYSIYGYLDGEQWQRRVLNLEAKESALLSKLPFDKGIIKNDDPLFKYSLRKLIEKGHNKPRTPTLEELRALFTEAAGLNTEYQIYREAYKAAEKERRKNTEIHGLISQIIETINELEQIKPKTEGEDVDEWKTWKQDALDVKARYENLQFGEEFEEDLGTIKQKNPKIIEELAPHFITGSCFLYLLALADKQEPDKAFMAEAQRKNIPVLIKKIDEWGDAQYAIYGNNFGVWGRLELYPTSKERPLFDNLTFEKSPKLDSIKAFADKPKESMSKNILARGELYKHIRKGHHYPREYQQDLTVMKDDYLAGMTEKFTPHFVDKVFARHLTALRMTDEQKNRLAASHDLSTRWGRLMHKLHLLFTKLKHFFGGPKHLSSTFFVAPVADKIRKLEMQLAEAQGKFTEREAPPAEIKPAPHR